MNHQTISSLLAAIASALLLSSPAGAAPPKVTIVEIPKAPPTEKELQDERDYEEMKEKNRKLIESGEKVCLNPAALTMTKKYSPGWMLFYCDAKDVPPSQRVPLSR